MRSRVLRLGLFAAMLIAACASFDATNDASSSDAGVDATDDAIASDASSGDSSSTDATQASCEPEPIDPFDAGPEPASCGPGGSVVQLNINPEHCGFCGNACGDGQCVQGTCVPPAVFTGDDAVIVGNAVVGSNLFFASNAAVDNSGGCPATHLRKLSTVSDAGATEVLGVDGGCTRFIATHDSTLAFYVEGSGLHLTPVADAALGAPFIAVPYNMSAMYLAPSGIFWSSFSTVRFEGYDGVDGPIVHDDPATEVKEITGDGDDVWWLVASTSDAMPEVDQIWTRNGKNGQSFQRQKDLPQARSIALDAEYTYVGFTSGEIKRFRRDGTGSLELVTRIEAPTTYPRALVVAGDNLFVFAGEPSLPDNNDVWVYRAKKCGGRARLIASGYLRGHNVQLVGKHIYYSDLGVLRRLDVSRWLP